MQTQTPQQMASRIVIDVLYEAAKEDSPKGAAARTELQRRRRERRERTRAAVDAAKAAVARGEEAIAAFSRVFLRLRS